MPLSLLNENLEIWIDEPLEAYQGVRFDWTGKIRSLKFKGLELLSSEFQTPRNQQFGAGLYNEFGIDTALAFEEAKTGEWFHKIGVGLLKKSDHAYHFLKPYQVQAAQFNVKVSKDAICIICQSELVHGYAYKLTKTISLEESGLNIEYQLENQGSKTIETEEYVHNFLGFAKRQIGPNYQLYFGFNINEKGFKEILNPAENLSAKGQSLRFQDTVNSEFFISHLNADKRVPAYWELQHQELGVQISEQGSFRSTKVNLWGKAHVISPELFCPILLASGETQVWSRHYRLGTSAGKEKAPHS